MRPAQSQNVESDGRSYAAATRCCDRNQFPVSCRTAGVHSSLLFLQTTGKEQALGVGPDTKKPGTRFGPGTFRQFQFHE
jgi:hypothetical protein